jgi:outer membrane protein
MKKLILSAAAVFVFSFANAQETSTFGFGEGNIIVEGNLGFNSTNDKNTDIKTSSFTFNPKAGYFITDDVAIGIELGVGAFARYYFLELGERFKTYGEFGLGFDTYKEEMGGLEAKASGFGAGLGLGMNYFITENFAINFALSDILSYSSYKPDGGEAISEFNGNINVFDNFFTTAQFGLTFKF